MGAPSSQGAHRAKRVARHQSGPHQIPERGHVFRSTGCGQSGRQQRIEEIRAAASKRGKQLLTAVVRWLHLARMWFLVGEVPANPSVGITDRTVTHPVDLAAGCEL